MIKLLNVYVCPFLMNITLTINNSRTDFVTLDLSDPVGNNPNPDPNVSKNQIHDPPETT